MQKNNDSQFQTVNRLYGSNLLTKQFSNDLKSRNGKITKSNENLLFQNKSQYFVQKKNYFLHDQYLICKNKYYDFENCQLTFENQSILLEKDGKQFLIKGVQLFLEQWYDHLKRFTIQRNFKKIYKKGDLLGKGSQAKVYKIVQIETNRTYATKLFDKKKLNQKSLNHLLKEIQILRKLDNEGVTKLHEVFENKKRIYLILDLLQGGELLEQIQSPNYKYNEQFVMDFALNLLEIINYIHSKGIMHRDLKPENLILRDKNDYTDIVIADFGLAEYYNTGNQSLEKCGTIGYIAPEVLQNQQYDNKVDIFSIGVIIYILFTGTLPFIGNTTEEVFVQNKNGNLNTEYLNELQITQTAKDFVILLLSQQPNLRPNAKQALDHQWFQLPFALTNNMIIHSLRNIPDLNQKEKFLSINCTSPLWKQNKIQQNSLESSDDMLNYFQKQSNEIDEINDDEFGFEDLDFETSLFTITPSQCCNYCFSNTKIRKLNELRDKKQI